MGYLDGKKRMTIGRILKKKASGEKIAVLTAYDHYTAHLLDEAGIDMTLVGDSAANVIHGYDSTLPITMDVMVAHCAAVARGTENALVIADMPFMSFQPSTETAILNAGRFLKEGGAHAVKLEGGLEIVPTVKRLVEIGIPVMGHIGLTPQSINRFGGPRVQGRKKKSQTYLKESALALEEAGAFSMVLELVENDTAREITESLKRAATIGIGAGVACDGQVLVINDILGLGDTEFKPKFVRRYADLSPVISDAVKRFIADVKSGEYPSDDESYGG
ncbi:MAG: 3-methyl-2-oxobutanoate hydroxymethyltransferase [candidate division Zixibacteria bacterium]|nr:3-methyl-2-oxobutanoate hydroxymethyltransferase [candidate division Zixibacteria bacterium]MDH3936892.1 3-methyl-2-oxobutanoate hydroxymethyltransferase [candidate division Zixibacteria bacterium]MDH4034739.1 3-methyl-2-oxobutanoate hydroxymethyltransferase [candidate division Zixibacteria bacterium]